MALKYRLIKFSTLTIYRQTQGTYVDGDWVNGIITTFDTKAKVQPLKESDLLLLPESDRNTTWLKVYIEEYLTPVDPPIRGAQQGVGGWNADEFVWEGYRYRVMADADWKDSILDHTRIFAARIEVSAS